jgi:hypothetical protein
VAATVSVAQAAPPAPEPLLLMIVVPPPPPEKNGYQRIDGPPYDDLDDEVLAVLVPGVGVGDTPSSSGMVMAVSGLRRKIGSPEAGISSVSAVPCASITRLERAWFQVVAPSLVRQLKP